MSIKTEKTIQVFDNDQNGTRLTLTIEEDATVGLLTLSSVETSAQFNVRLIDIDLFASFFTAVADDQAE